ncbi:MAG: hypothetical protein LC785_02585 [Acidobacteria bacterium]|nr:hypothetical protein [Acidobacteriota bacterium]MCA1640873.1 hypothetical protein [Acidobacteriota bacterium]
MLVTALALTFAPCPRRGCALTAEKRAFVLLKNRESQPAESDFDRAASLDALLAAGDDRARWSESRAAAVEGYVVDVQVGGVESSNCFSLTRRDVHVHVARRADAPATETVVVEVTPRSAAAARARGLDWSLRALRRDLTGRLCRFEGWLLYDREHADEALNTAPGNPVDWRATAWELHPVTRIDVLK